MGPRVISGYESDRTVTSLGWVSIIRVVYREHKVCDLMVSGNHWPCGWQQLTAFGGSRLTTRIFHMDICNVFFYGR